IATDRAADAAVRGFEDFLFRADDELMVDPDLAELVLDDRDSLAVTFGQDAIQQRRLARAEKACEDGDRNSAVSHGNALSRDRRKAPGRAILSNLEKVACGPFSDSSFV